MRRKFVTSTEPVIYRLLELRVEHVRERLWRLHKQGRLNQTALAKRLRVKPSAISKVLNTEGRTISLELLIEAAELAQVPLAELVAAENSAVKELDPEEAALLRHLRKWPRHVRRSLLDFLAFFADEEPAVTQTRNLHALWRQIGKPSDRDWIYGVVQMVVEGILPPDLREGLVGQLRDEQQRQQAGRAKQKRLTPGRRDET